MKYTRLHGHGTVGQRYVEKGAFIKLFCVEIHVLLNFEPIYRLTIHSIITSTCETIFHLSFLFSYKYQAINLSDAECM